MGGEEHGWGWKMCGGSMPFVVLQKVYSVPTTAIPSKSIVVQYTPFRISPLFWCSSCLNYINWELVAVPSIPCRVRLTDLRLVDL